MEEKKSQKQVNSEDELKKQIEQIKKELDQTDKEWYQGMLEILGGLHTKKELKAFLKGVKEEQKTQEMISKALEEDIQSGRKETIDGVFKLYKANQKFTEDEVVEFLDYLKSEIEIENDVKKDLENDGQNLEFSYLSEIYNDKRFKTDLTPEQRKDLIGKLLDFGADPNFNVMAGFHTSLCKEKTILDCVIGNGDFGTANLILEKSKYPVKLNISFLSLWEPNYHSSLDEYVSLDAIKFVDKLLEGGHTNLDKDELRTTKTMRPLQRYYVYRRDQMKKAKVGAKTENKQSGLNK